MNFAVQPGLKAYIWACLFMIVLPVVITAAALLLGARSLAPGLLAGIALTGALLCAVTGWMMWRTEIVLEQNYLRITAGFYARQVPHSSIDLSSSEIVDFAARTELEPGLRTNGVGLPGYRVGWYRLKNGDRAFVVLTGGRVMYLPLRRGESLLLSINRPSVFREQLGQRE